MTSKHDKEQRGKEGLEKAIREEFDRRGITISSREIDKRVQKVQEYADKTGMIK